MFCLIGLTFHTAVFVPFLHPKIHDFELYAKEKPELNELLSKYRSLSIEINEGKFVIEEDLKKMNEL